MRTAGQKYQDIELIQLAFRALLAFPIPPGEILHYPIKAFHSQVSKRQAGWFPSLETKFELPHDQQQSSLQ